MEENIGNILVKVTPDKEEHLGFYIDIGESVPDEYWDLYDLLKCTIEDRLEEKYKEIIDKGTCFNIELIDVILLGVEVGSGEGYGMGDVDIEIHWEDEKVI